MKHSIIKTGDADVFPQILDRNHEVALRYCRRCKKGEGELEASCTPEDWTLAENGRTNSSPQFNKLVDEVSQLMRQNGGHCLSVEWADKTAQLIMAQLAHVHGLAPKR